MKSVILHRYIICCTFLANATLSSDMWHSSNTNRSSKNMTCADNGECDRKLEIPRAFKPHNIIDFHLNFTRGKTDTSNYGNIDLNYFKL